MIDLAAWIQAAEQQGVPKSEIARLGGVSRPTVYALLADSD